MFLQNCQIIQRSYKKKEDHRRRGSKSFIVEKVGIFFFIYNPGNSPLVNIKTIYKETVSVIVIKYLFCA